VRGSGRGAEVDVGGQISEVASVLDSIAADPADALTVLVREDAPAVDLTPPHRPNPVCGTARGRAWVPRGCTLGAPDRLSRQRQASGLRLGLALPTNCT
jgi:hypothetical protein